VAPRASILLTNAFYNLLNVFVSLSLLEHAPKREKKHGLNGDIERILVRSVDDVPTSNRQLVEIRDWTLFRFSLGSRESSLVETGGNLSGVGNIEKSRDQKRRERERENSV